MSRVDRKIKYIPYIEKREVCQPTCLSGRPLRCCGECLVVVVFFLLCKHALPSLLSLRFHVTRCLTLCVYVCVCVCACVFVGKKVRNGKRDRVCCVYVE